MLVAWWWLVIVGMVAGSLGLLIGACCSASKRGDCWEEVVNVRTKEKRRL